MIVMGAVINRVLEQVESGSTAYTRFSWFFVRRFGEFLFKSQVLLNYVGARQRQQNRGQ